MRLTSYVRPAIVNGLKETERNCRDTIEEGRNLQVCRQASIRRIKREVLGVIKWTESVLVEAHEE